MISNYICPNCGSAHMGLFYSVERAPIHSVLLLPTHEEATSYPVGQIKLGLCSNCGFIANTEYDPTHQEYGVRYEATQSFSSTFNNFAYNLATNLIERYDLHEKDIIEIGCGQGEFLLQLCELGGNRGVGFDPAYRGDAPESEARDRVEFISDFYSEKYSDYQGDFVCCKMTLEHIKEPYEFISTVRRSIGDHLDTVVFFQIPNGAYVIRDLAFWDVYYEHCSYFTRGSLTYLFERSGFEVLRVYTGYNSQYLMIEAKPRLESIEPVADPIELDDIRNEVARFSKCLPPKFEEWRTTLSEMIERGERIAIWGGGSKGVAFLTTLGIRDEIPYVVDINPRKRGMFMAGLGQEIVAPEFLKTYRPDTIIVMNPIYCDEIRATLDGMGVNARLVPV